MINTTYLPEISLEKSLFSDENLGILDLQSNIKVHNYDTNKTSKFVTNSFNWNKNLSLFENGISNSLANIKNFNYETNNIDPFKEDFTSNYTVLWIFSELNFFKNKNGSEQFLNPKMLFRYAQEA